MTPEQMQALVEWVVSQAHYAAAARAESDFTGDLLEIARNRQKEMLDMFGYESTIDGIKTKGR